tara:strand:- start:631 stop:1206 length:576 start_codon:yes stop_codon:yes gene_type:complete
MNSGRVKFLLIVFIFIFPFIVSYYLSKDYWAGGDIETSNYGSFINPILNISDTEFVNYNGNTRLINDLKDKWTLIYNMPLECNSDCMEEIHLIRQVNIALGKDMNRLQRILLIPQSIQQVSLQKILTEYPKLIIVKKDNSSFPQTIKKIDNNFVLFLSDPLGNVILGYEKKFKGKKLLKDIKKLFKLSKIG